MQLTFDTEKFMETNLGLYDYMILVMYEQNTRWTAKELSKHLSITERTCYAKRKALIEQGWLNEWGVHYLLSEKYKMLVAA